MLLCNCLPDVSSFSVFVVLLVGLQYVIVVLPDHAHLFFLLKITSKIGVNMFLNSSICLSYRACLCANFYHMTLRLGA